MLYEVITVNRVYLLLLLFRLYVQSYHTIRDNGQKKYHVYYREINT